MLASGLASVRTADASTAAFAATLLRSRVQLHAAGCSFFAQQLRQCTSRRVVFSVLTVLSCALQISRIRQQPFASHALLHRGT